MKHGVLLINLGTPDTPTYTAVWRYLREFLSDKRVITLPKFLRYALLYGIILPFRTHRTTHAYKQIWTKDGSPLRFHSEQICTDLQNQLGHNYIVSLGMRYGNPSLQDAILKLSTCSEITILPLFPHYSSAASGSAIEHALTIIAQQNVIPNLHIIRDFYKNEYFVQAESEQLKPYIKEYDFILFSYHGLPQQHLHASGCVNNCTRQCPTITQDNFNCYRAQCFETSRMIAKKLNLSEERYATSFQSRLGKVVWVQPYTDQILSQLIENGIKSLAIVCPSFITDCLETIEEIGMQIEKQWLALGGEKFTLVPGLNENNTWMKYYFR